MRRIFVDESGDHTYSPAVEVGKRYLGVVGVIMSRAAHEALAVRLEKLKADHLTIRNPGDHPVLHRVDILNARGAFAPLADPAKRAPFDEDLLRLIAETDFVAIAIVIDKVTHAPKRYRAIKHPYHWAVLALLERYCGWLRYHALFGDLLAESRGKEEDKAFRLAYREFRENGAGYLTCADAQARLTCADAQLEKKDRNTAGLQLADTLAHPLTRDVLLAYERITDRGGPFADRIAAIVERKYNRRVDTGRIDGYGRKMIG